MNLINIDIYAVLMAKYSFSLNFLLGGLNFRLGISEMIA
jgi:hypothetical protein